MAIVQHLVWTTIESMEGITSAVIAIDDTVDTDDDAVRDRAASQISSYYSIKLPAGYFTNNRAISVYDAAGDFTVFRYANIPPIDVIS